ncbi:MAG: DNRLRE domain-containing protein [Candidatus Bathyarchaeota archaeon]|nr:DNRLRE domain-containing protein [Candidatus Bathyarchaeota archaeon]MDH5596330.1 DNRLRE domain-containing protein [Candidatus Bathyarchaeota archaeon]
MKHKILAPTILLILFVSSALIANASEPETIMPLEDTYVDAFSIDTPFGDEDYLEVSNYASGLSIIALMFDISKVTHVFNASSEVKLRLYCFYVASPHIVGIHWCPNNTWNEENLTFASFKGFYRTNPEDVVRVDSIDVWYEWKVTNFVRNAVEEDHENITLTLEVKDPLEGPARSLFASKDQTPQDREYSPQLAFTYGETETNSPDITIIVAIGLTATVAIIFLAWKFSERHKTKTRHRKIRSKSHLRRRQEK